MVRHRSSKPTPAGSIPATRFDHGAILLGRPTAATRRRRVRSTLAPLAVVVHRRTAGLLSRRVRVRVLPAACSVREAQLDEHPATNRGVVGSTPSANVLAPESTEGLLTHSARREVNRQPGRAHRASLSQLDGRAPVSEAGGEGSIPSESVRGGVVAHDGLISRRASATLGDRNQRSDPRWSRARLIRGKCRFDSGRCDRINVTISSKGPSRSCSTSRHDGQAVPADHRFGLARDERL